MSGAVMDPINREQLFRELTQIQERMDEGFNGIHARLDLLNGRVRRTENKVVVMWVLWGILGTLATVVAPQLFRAFGS